MNTPPPAYTPQRLDRTQSLIHQAHHPSNSHQSQRSRPNSYHPTNTDDRGLGSLVIGLGAATLVNHAIQRPSPTSSAHHHHHQDHDRREDPLALLARFDTILLIDDSASMSNDDLWSEAASAVSGLANTLVRYDADGIEVYFMNSTEYLHNARSAQAVDELFRRVRPVGLSTPTDVRVEELLGLYLDRLEATKASNLPALKPLNMIVITDGVADDPDTLAYALAGFAERLDQGRFPLTQLGVQFIQIGKDRAATMALKELDDELRSTYGVKRDIVDTTPYKGRVTAEFIMKALLGGINKRIDKS